MSEEIKIAKKMFNYLLHLPKGPNEDSQSEKPTIDNKTNLQNISKREVAEMCLLAPGLEKVLGRLLDDTIKFVALTPGFKIDKYKSCGDILYKGEKKCYVVELKTSQNTTVGQIEAYRNLKKFDQVITETNTSKYRHSYSSFKKKVDGIEPSAEVVVIFLVDDSCFEEGSLNEIIKKLEGFDNYTFSQLVEACKEYSGLEDEYFHVLNKIIDQKYEVEGSHIVKMRINS